MPIEDFEVKVKKAFNNQPFPEESLTPLPLGLQLERQSNAPAFFEDLFYIAVPISPTQLFALRVIERPAFAD